MKYMLLICEDPAARPTTAEQGAALMARYTEFTDGIHASGEWAAGDRLHGVETATCVRVNDGAVSVTDGPFVETKEHLGGFYIVDVADLDRALELAAQIPAAAHGVVEVRPLWEM
jgi:hypothetical protein